MVFTQHSVFLQKHHGITIVHFYQHVPCIHFHMFPFLFAHTPSEHQICACVSKCVGVYLCVSGKRRVSVSEALLTQFVRQQKTLHCFFDYATFPPLLPRWPFHYCMTPSVIHSPSAESRLALSKSALFPLSVTYWRLFSVWWFSAKRDHLRSSDLHPQSVNQSVSHTLLLSAET